MMLLVTIMIRNISISTINWSSSIFIIIIITIIILSFSRMRRFKMEPQTWQPYKMAISSKSPLRVPFTNLEAFKYHPL